MLSLEICGKSGGGKLKSNDNRFNTSLTITQNYLDFCLFCHLTAEIEIINTLYTMFSDNVNFEDEKLFSIRRQKDGRIFPVAVYTCDEDYELENEDNDRLYCSKRKWIGIHPNCMQLEETYDENGEGEEEEEEGNLRWIRVFVFNISFRNIFIHTVILSYNF